ncbi:MAG: hypothetical protein ACRDDA_05225 [Aeromonas sp.]
MRKIYEEIKEEGKLVDNSLVVLSKWAEKFEKKWSCKQSEAEKREAESNWKTRGVFRKEAKKANDNFRLWHTIALASAALECVKERKLNDHKRKHHEKAQEARPLRKREVSSVVPSAPPPYEMGGGAQQRSAVQAPLFTVKGGQLEMEQFEDEDNESFVTRSVASGHTDEDKKCGRTATVEQVIYDRQM